MLTTRPRGTQTIHPAPSEDDFVTLRVPKQQRTQIRPYGQLPLPQPIANEMGEDGFAVRIPGPHLQSYGICAGDYVLCRRQDTALPGQLVAIFGHVFDGMCIRVYPHSGDHLLLPEGNQDPIAAAAPPRSIQDVYGVVIAVERPHQTIRLEVPYSRLPSPHPG